MIEDRLANSLENMDFHKLDSNVKGFYLYYKIIGNVSSIISIIQAPSGSEVTIEQYKSILAQIKDNFKSRGVSEIHLLSLIFTREVDRVKQLCLEEDEHWIIDLNSSRLIIYETQASDFMGLRSEIEKILEEEQNYTQRINPFSLCNTIIILTNIAAFFVLYHTKLFGGTDKMMEQGVLYWYLVKNNGEYYRLLTSMFMHADLGHLFNNMLALFFIGGILERATGRIKYLLIYFGTGIIAGIASISYNMMKGQVAYSIGASGAIFGVVGAMLYVLLVNRGRLENINSRQMILFVIFSLYGGIANAGIDEVAHIGGFIAGLIFAVILYRRPKRKDYFIHRED